MLFNNQCSLQEADGMLMKNVLFSQIVRQKDLQWHFACASYLRFSFPFPIFVNNRSGTSDPDLWPLCLTLVIFSGIVDLNFLHALRRIFAHFFVLCFVTLSSCLVPCKILDLFRFFCESLIHRTTFVCTNAIKCPITGCEAHFVGCWFCSIFL